MSKKMTVADLIAKLSMYPEDMPVVVVGFDEWGYDNPEIFEIMEMKPIAPRLHGPDYEPCDSQGKATGPAFQALFIR